MSSSNLEKTIAYWKDILDLKVFDQTENSVLLGYSEDQAKIEFKDIGNDFIMLCNTLIIQIVVMIKHILFD